MDLKKILFIYLAIVLIFSIAAMEPIGGRTPAIIYTNASIEQIQNLSYEYQNSTQGITELLGAAGSFVGIYIDIVIESLFFQFEITDAPDLVNTFIAGVFMLMAWAAFAEFAYALFSAALSLL